MSRGPGRAQRWLLDRLEAVAAEHEGAWISLTDLARLRCADECGEQEARQANWRMLRPWLESLRRAARTLPASIEAQSRVYGGRGSNVLLRRAGRPSEPALTWRQEDVVRQALAAQVETINAGLRAIGSQQRLTVGRSAPVEPVRVLIADDPAKPVVQEFKVTNGYYLHPFPRDTATVADDEVHRLATSSRWRRFPLGALSAVLADLLAASPELAQELLRLVELDAQPQPAVPAIASGDSNALQPT